MMSILFLDSTEQIPTTLHRKQKRQRKYASEIPEVHQKF